MRVVKSLKWKPKKIFWKNFENFIFWSKNTFFDPFFIKMSFFLENRPGDPTKRVPWRKSSKSGLFGEFFSFWYPWTFHSTVRYSICVTPSWRSQNNWKSTFNYKNSFFRLFGTFLEGGEHGSAIRSPKWWSLVSIQTQLTQVRLFKKSFKKK